ncbi:MAG: hypothetical protein IJ301_00760 [Clostridia bacterium]|nr:hypothetical protein [Clostridia bacterium]
MKIMVETKKSCLWKAMLFSALCCLGGAVLFGLVYSVGYITYAVGFLSAALSYSIFLKFYNKMPFWSVLWVIFFAFLFSEIALIITVSISLISIEPTLSFGEALSLLFAMIGEEPVVSSAFVQDTAITGFLIVIGAIGCWIGYKLKMKKEEQKQNTTAVTPQNESRENVEIAYQATNEYISYESVKYDYKRAMQEYHVAKDKSKLNQDLRNLKEKYQSMTQANREEILNKAQLDLQNTNLNVDDKATLIAIIKYL